jgi:hypothetical protein
MTSPVPSHAYPLENGEKRGGRSQEKRPLAGAPRFGRSTAHSTIECIVDEVKAGKVASFPRDVELEPDETIAFSWIVYAFVSAPRRARSRQLTVRWSIGVFFARPSFSSRARDMPQILAGSEGTTQVICIR